MRTNQPFRLGADKYAAAPSFVDRLGRLASWISAWMMTRAHHRGATVLYEELNRLPDVELQVRGLSRGTLARDIGNACDRGWVLPNREQSRERPERSGQ